MQKKHIIIIGVTILVGLSGYLGYELYSLNQAHAALNDDFDQLTHRSDLLQRKYTEQKAQTAALQRAKLTVEGLKRQAEMKLEELAKEMEKKDVEMAALRKKVGANVKDLEDRIESLNTTIEEWEKKYEDRTKEFHAARQTISERDATIAKMEENIGELKSSLQFATSTKDRYLKNNRQMAATAKSILARYDEDGVFAEKLLRAEPFTQLKKVELEKLIQKYLDEVDDQVIRE